MDRIVSSELYNILNQISDQNFNPEQIFSVFKREIPGIAQKYGMTLLSATLYEPIKRSSEFNVTKFDLYDVTNGEKTNDLELQYPTGNGGRLVVTTGLNKDGIWTRELKEDNYVLSRMIYLLVGRAKTMASLQNLTFFDQLTGIFNETGLGKQMSMVMAQGQFHNYCSNFINIKNMKLLNNRFGDPAGDVAMIGFAKRISEFSKTHGNGTAARLGGDNFFVFIEKSYEGEFLEFLKDIKVPYTKSNGEEINIKVTSRVGYYFINPGDGFNETMRNADIAAKMARLNNYPEQVKFEESMQIMILKMRQLEQSVPEAIEKKEFKVYYQAKADISEEGNYKINGSEALVRWQKEDGMVQPGDFVPILEKTGLIRQIDFYVLEQICEDIKEWLARGIEPVKVSSNFSRRHLHNPDFANQVADVIKKHGVDPKYIEIEITESYDDEDMQALTKFEKKMHEIGVTLSVDDFGAGFSSLKMIKNIVADTIKLDMSLIDGIGNNGPDDIIISHIIQMINCLGKHIIAEGVETEKQAKFLRENNCNSIQGFLFARPVPKEEYEKLLK